ncbi:MAG: hypothetical protein HN457_14630 [Opitutales bacterium]|nr:hypothetical protein [Opitutales bacterium]MDG2256573.1 hypothetical protein [Opitutaceae bacterium]MBT5168345.1 hypothetical protein [Opitutales bacterium]MBT5813804.1 hypothetical protein [Opitutales bacterium]MBT6380972.1 hypothetical protein [Opitutales bacterium]
MKTSPEASTHLIGFWKGGANQLWSSYAAVIVGIDEIHRFFVEVEASSWAGKGCPELEVERVEFLSS